MRYITGLIAALGLVAVAGSGCSSSSGGYGVTNCPNEPTPAACVSCVQSSCSSEVSMVNSACSSFYDCVCPKGADAGACTMTASCSDALSTASTQCTACASECTTSMMVTSTGGDGGSAGDGGTTLCCNKLTDNTTSCTGDAMPNDECTCLPVPAGTPCSQALPDAGPIVAACTGYACCFALTSGGCQCISAGDMSSCYASMTCAQVATVNGGTMSSSCP